MKILIIYELIPENTKLYLEEVTSEEWEWMKLTQNNFVNACQPGDACYEPCQNLMHWLEDKESADLKEQPYSLKGMDVDYVLFTGFLL